MLGPTTVALMLAPVVLGVVVALLVVRRAQGDAWRVSGVWLILVAVPVAVACDQLRPQVEQPSVVNRLEAVVLCTIAAAFVYLNRDRARLVAASSWTIAAGVVLNASGVLVFGAMPVLQTAAAAADKPFTGSHPSPGYIRSDDLGAFGIAIGDFIPIPHFEKVLSIGDLGMLAGCVVLLGLFLARLWRSEPIDGVPHELTTGEEVTHG